MKKLVQSLMVCGYILMATLTGMSRERECGLDGVFPKTSEWAGASAIHGAFWPYRLYEYRQKTGSTNRFFPRGHFCNSL